MFVLEITSKQPIGGQLGASSLKKGYVAGVALQRVSNFTFENANFAQTASLGGGYVWVDAFPNPRIETKSPL